MWCLGSFLYSVSSLLVLVFIKYSQCKSTKMFWITITLVNAVLGIDYFPITWSIMTRCYSSHPSSRSLWMFEVILICSEMLRCSWGGQCPQWQVEVYDLSNTAISIQSQIGLCGRVNLDSLSAPIKVKTLDSSNLELRRPPTSIETSTITRCNLVNYGWRKGWNHKPKAVSKYSHSSEWGFWDK